MAEEESNPGAVADSYLHPTATLDKLLVDWSGVAYLTYVL